MLAKLTTYSLLGIDALPVEVEVDIYRVRFPKRSWLGWRKPPCVRALIGSNELSSTAAMFGLWTGL